MRSRHVIVQTDINTTDTLGPSRTTCNDGAIGKGTRPRFREGRVQMVAVRGTVATLLPNPQSRDQNGNAAPRGGISILVAGRGFEPLTFGL